MSILVKDTNLPDFVPRLCPICKFDLEVNESLTKLYCTNDICPGKVAERFNDFCTHFSIKGIGLAGLTKCIDYYGFANPFNLVSLALDNEIFYEGIPDSVQLSVTNQLVNLYNARLTLPEIIEGMYLPSIGRSSALAIFGDVSKDEWNNDYLNKCFDLTYLKEKLGISQYESQRAINIRESLLTFYEDINSSVDIMNGFIEPNKSSINLVGAYTDKVPTDLARTKRDFYKFMADNFPDINIIWKDSVTKGSNFLISGTGEATHKLEKANKMGIPVFDENSFIDWLQELRLEDKHV